MAEHAWRLSVRNETIPRRRRGNQGEACIIDEWTQTAIDARGGVAGAARSLLPRAAAAI